MYNFYSHFRLVYFIHSFIPLFLRRLPVIFCSPRILSFSGSFFYCYIIQFHTVFFVGLCISSSYLCHFMNWIRLHLLSAFKKNHSHSVIRRFKLSNMFDKTFQLYSSFFGWFLWCSIFIDGKLQQLCVVVQSVVSFFLSFSFISMGSAQKSRKGVFLSGKFMRPLI